MNAGVCVKAPLIPATAIMWHHSSDEAHAWCVLSGLRAGCSGVGAACAEARVGTQGCTLPPMVALLLTRGHAATRQRALALPSGVHWPPREEFQRLRLPSPARDRSRGADEPPLWQQPLCFVHVNKAGGGSINRGIRHLLMLLRRRSPTLTPGPRYAELHGLEGSAANDTWRPKAGGRVPVTFPMGPLRAPIDFCVDPAQPARHTLVLWVRDPIERLVSSWNFVRAVATGEPMERPMPSGAVEAYARDWRGVGGWLWQSLGVNASSGLAVALEAARAAGRLSELLAKVGHGRETLARYLLAGDPSLNAASHLQFVGRLESCDEDWSRLQRLLGVPSWALLPLPHRHRTPRERTRPLRAPLVAALHQTLAVSLACIWWLEAVCGLLPAGYHANVSGSRLR